MKKLLLLLFILSNFSVIAQPSCDWAYVPIGTGTTYNNIYYLKTDHSGNSIVLGKILGSADMDPATGPADTSFSSVGYNWYISKTSIAGKLEWIHYFQNNSQIAFFEFKGLEINSRNEIVVCGNFYGMVDFDLSDNGVDTLRSHFSTYPDYFIAKYDSLGNYAWAINIGDSTTNDIQIQSMALLPNDNIIISANPNGVLDVDPSNAIHNSIGNNANIICYDNNGAYVWNNHISPLFTYGVPVQSIDCDASGNSYIASVGYYELTISKFDNVGMYMWSKKIGNFSANGRVDPQTILVNKTTSEFYIAGTFGGTVDFDPGVGVINRTSSSGFFQDGFIAKYDFDMNLIWLNTFQGEVSFGSNSLDFNTTGVAAVGSLKGNIDFGNGLVFSSPTNTNSFYLNIDTSGYALDAFAINGNGKFYGLSTTINQSFVVIGNITSTTDMDPGTPVYSLNATAANFFTAVYHTTLPTITSEHAKNLMIEVFPNPSKNSFNIKVDASLIGSNYKCFDYTGKMIKEGKIESLYTDIQLEGSAAGIYFLKLNGKTTETLKLIKS